MSTVYRAFDEKLERAVAIKVLHSAISSEADQLERFRREARAAARLSHPNVVNVIDAGEDDGVPYIVFEYVEGETLKERIRRVGRLPSAEAVAYAIEIGRGLSAAHAERLVHRDVKPQNVLLSAEGQAKVTDFGIARSLEMEGLTAPGSVLGTTTTWRQSRRSATLSPNARTSTRSASYSTRCLRATCHSKPTPRSAWR